MPSIQVEIGKETRFIEAAEGSNLLTALLADGIDDIPSTCGGRGTCKKCKVELLPGASAEPEVVLACQTRVTQNLTVRILPERGMEINADLGNAQFGNDLPFELPAETRQAYGIAVDIGTTTVVAMLFDLMEGPRSLAVFRERNLEKQFGADVISRIDYSNHHGVAPVTDLIRKQIATMVRQLLRENHVAIQDLYGYSIAGNTVMQHYMAGFDPQGIGVAPFKVQSLFGEVWQARDFGLPGADGCTVYFLPAIAGYVGGDITGGILATGMQEGESMAALLDIGTNGEIVIGNSSRMSSCATAAGPAFEGAEIEQGLPIVPGAITHVDLAGDRLELEIYQSKTPIGFCGSGLIDALAVVLELGLVEESGRIIDPADSPPEWAWMLGEREGSPVLWFTADESIYLSQKDIRQLQLAKAAIAAGFKTLLEFLKLDADNLDILYLAGGFGSKVRSSSLVRIGLIPPEFGSKAQAVGNTALQGAAMALASNAARRRLAEIREHCSYIELSNTPEFVEHYLEGMFFSKP